LSISNSNNDLSPYLSDETRIFKSFDLKLQEKIVSCATHVRRTSIVNKEKLSDGGIMVNQYKLLQKVGRGAFGKVFKAVDDLGNTVAVKIYNKRRLRSKWIGKGRTALQLVTSEIEIMQAASHERLINLFEVINQEDYHKIYLVIEYAEGGTLHKRGKFEEQAARKCFKQLIEGLSYLHETLKVIHRDIKPQNILFDSEGNLKIADFGSAQFLQNGQDELTSSAGTYAFMSPEMHGGSKMFKGKPTDIWAAGITLYYMIEGKTPFKSKALLDLMNEVKTEEIVFPNHFSPHLKELLSGMLEKDPDKRISIDEIKQSSWFSIEN
jgi:serine/threonine protein kinase